VCRITPSSPTAQPVWLSTKNTSLKYAVTPLVCAVQLKFCANVNVEAVKAIIVNNLFILTVLNFSQNKQELNSECFFKGFRLSAGLKMINSA
jgi:hypothetical protein